jgi:magnesium chelatase family protein
MPSGRAYTIALSGVQGHVVEIVAEVEPGAPGILLAGLPDSALRQTRDRIRAASINAGAGLHWPDRRITVGLSPASLPKPGSHSDLAIAAAIHAATGAIPAARLASTAFLGELGLDGAIRPVRGILPATSAAAAAGFNRVVVPVLNAPEAALVPGIEVVAAPSLEVLAGWLRGQAAPAGQPATRLLRHGTPTAAPPWDMADIAGQAEARRAAEIAAAGGHALLLTGRAGSGAVLLAERIPGLLPPLGETAAREVTELHSLAGTLTPDRPLITTPPVIAPHYTTTMAAMLGGGTGLIKPGAASLAHRGVLLLGSAPEFDRTVLTALRQPIDSGQVVVARGGLTARFPAEFITLLTAAPCPCSLTSDRGIPCTCTPMQKHRYQARVPTALADRIDLKAWMHPPGRGTTAGESSAAVAARVLQARERAARRLAGTPWRLNARIPDGEVDRTFRPADNAAAPLVRAMDLGQLTRQGSRRVIRTAWTVADLNGVDQPGPEEIRTALDLWLGNARSPGRLEPTTARTALTPSPGALDPDAAVDAPDDCHNAALTAPATSHGQHQSDAVQHLEL